jgi:hypothetical protein
MKIQVEEQAMEIEVKNAAKISSKHANLDGEGHN